MGPPGAGVRGIDYCASMLFNSSRALRGPGNGTDPADRSRSTFPTGRTTLTSSTRTARSRPRTTLSCLRSSPTTKAACCRCSSRPRRRTHDITVWAVGLISFGPPTAEQIAFIAGAGPGTDPAGFPGDYIAAGFPHAQNDFEIGVRPSEVRRARRPSFTELTDKPARIDPGHESGFRLGQLHVREHERRTGGVLAPAAVRHRRQRRGRHPGRPERAVDLARARG